MSKPPLQHHCQLAAIHPMLIRFNPSQVGNTPSNYIAWLAGAALLFAYHGGKVHLTFSQPYHEDRRYHISYTYKLQSVFASACKMGPTPEHH